MNETTRREHTIRRALPGDAERIAAIYASSFPEHIMVHKGLLNNPSFLEKRLENQGEFWAVAENKNDGCVLGVAALAMIPEVGLGEIERVCVDKNIRGNGIAYGICGFLTEYARKKEFGFVEAFARGDQPAMQRTFEKLGFYVYGIAPRFEIVHDGKIVREQFVHMGLELKPYTIDLSGLDLIPSAKRIFDEVKRKFPGGIY